MKSEAQIECRDRADPAGDCRHGQLRQQAEGSCTSASSSEPPPLQRRERWREATKVLMWMMLPLLAGAAVASKAALPLGLVGAFDLLPSGNNGLGFGLLAALGVFLGGCIAALGEVVLLGLWVRSWGRRRRKKALLSGGSTTVVSGEWLPPPPLPVGAPHMER